MVPPVNENLAYQKKKGIRAVFTEVKPGKQIDFCKFYMATNLNLTDEDQMGNVKYGKQNETL